MRESATVATRASVCVYDLTLFPPRAYTAAPLTRKNIPNCPVAHTNGSQCSPLKRLFQQERQVTRTLLPRTRPVLVLRCRHSGGVGVVDCDERHVSKSQQPPCAGSARNCGRHGVTATRLRIHRGSGLPRRSDIVSELAAVATWVPQPNAFGCRRGDHHCDITRAGGSACLDGGACPVEIWDGHYNLARGRRRRPQDYSRLQLETLRYTRTY